MTAAAETQRRRRHGREIAAAGAIAGLVGGAAMGMFLMLDLGGLDMGLLSPFADIAAAVLGPRALVGGSGTVLLGVAIHAAFSILFGVLFALIVPRDSGGGPALSYGLTASLLIMVVMTFAILPWADPTLSARIRFFQISWLFAHVIFGVALAFVPSLRRSAQPPREVASSAV